MVSDVLVLGISDIIESVYTIIAFGTQKKTFLFS